MCVVRRSTLLVRLMLNFVGLMLVRGVQDLFGKSYTLVFVHTSDFCLTEINIPAGIRGRQLILSFACPSIVR